MTISILKATMEQICGIVEESKIECRFCGETLRGQDVGYYDHDGGVEIQDFSKRQWVYFVCSKCGYQWALWKLLQRIKKRKRKASA